MSPPADPTAPAAPRAVTNIAEAELLMKHLMDVMDALLGVVEQETELVRAGDLAGRGQARGVQGGTVAALLYRRGAPQGQPGLSQRRRCRTFSRRCASATTCSTRCCR